jgi:hypothetical protein
MAVFSDNTHLVQYAEKHVHTVQLVRPHLADSVLVTADAAAWTYGALSNDLIAIDSMTDEFDIHWIDIKANGNDQYQLAIVAGASTVIAEASFQRAVVQNVTFSFPITTPVQAIGTQIRAKVATSAGSNTCNIKLLIHIY